MRAPDEDRTRVMRHRDTPPPPPAGHYAAGQPAYPLPGAAPRPAAPPPVPPGPPAAPPPAPPKGRSRVYGRERSGKSPVQPLRASGSGAGRSGGPRGPRSPRRIGKIIVWSLAGLLSLLLVALAGGFFWLNSRLTGIEVFTDYEGRPEETPGTDWLLVGSDSREGLTAKQRRQLATGKAVGKRTDTMMLLHIPEGDGRPTLVSLPRDTLTPIDGHGSDKLNAAYSYPKDGGPQLLTKTVEQITGIRIDHYMEIGFAGFVDIVDAVGGVEICVKQSIKDPKAGINLKKGCQVLDGGTALGYVRTRATGAIPDFDRTQRQRQFFSAVVKKAASPGVLLNPFTALPLATSATESVAVDEGTGALDLLSLGLAMSDNPVTANVPVSGFPTINGVNYVKWDTPKARQLFRALAEDRPVPKELLK